jgi:hypothetical protein
VHRNGSHRFDLADFFSLAWWGSMGPRPCESLRWHHSTSLECVLSFSQHIWILKKTLRLRCKQIHCSICAHSSHFQAALITMTITGGRLSRPGIKTGRSMRW